MTFVTVYVPGYGKRKYAKHATTEQAWEIICDHFPLGGQFTLYEAIAIAFPGMARKNYVFYADKLRALMQRIEAETGKEGIPHVRYVGGERGKEVWVFPLV